MAMQEAVGETGLCVIARCAEAIGSRGKKAVSAFDEDLFVRPLHTEPVDRENVLANCIKHLTSRQLARCLLAELDSLREPLVPLRLYPLVHSACQASNSSSRRAILASMLRQMPYDRVLALSCVLPPLESLALTEHSLRLASRLIAPRVSRRSEWNGSPYSELFCRLLIRWHYQLIPKWARSRSPSLTELPHKASPSKRFAAPKLDPMSPQNANGEHHGVPACSPSTVVSHAETLEQAKDAAEYPAEENDSCDTGVVTAVTLDTADDNSAGSISSVGEHAIATELHSSLYEEAEENERLSERKLNTESHDVGAQLAADVVCEDRKQGKREQQPEQRNSGENMHHALLEDMKQLDAELQHYHSALERSRVHKAHDSGTHSLKRALEEQRSMHDSKDGMEWKSDPDEGLWNDENGSFRECEHLSRPDNIHAVDNCGDPAAYAIESFQQLGISMSVGLHDWLAAARQRKQFINAAEQFLNYKRRRILCQWSSVFVGEQEQRKAAVTTALERGHSKTGICGWQCDTQVDAKREKFVQKRTHSMLKRWTRALILTRSLRLCPSLAAGSSTQRLVLARWRSTSENLYDMRKCRRRNAEELTLALKRSSARRQTSVQLRLMSISFSLWRRRTYTLRRTVESVPLGQMEREAQTSEPEQSHWTSLIHWRRGACAASAAKTTPNSAPSTRLAHSVRGDKSNCTGSKGDELTSLNVGGEQIHDATSKRDQDHQQAGDREFSESDDDVKLTGKKEQAPDLHIEISSPPSAPSPEPDASSYASASPEDMPSEEVHAHFRSNEETEHGDDSKERASSQMEHVCANAALDDDLELFAEEEPEHLQERDDAFGEKRSSLSPKPVQLMDESDSSSNASSRQRSPSNRQPTRIATSSTSLRAGLMGLRKDVAVTSWRGLARRKVMKEVERRANGLMSYPLDDDTLCDDDLDEMNDW